MSSTNQSSQQKLTEQWADMLLEMKNIFDISEISFRTWLSPLQVYDVNEEKKIISILAPMEQVVVGYIQKKFYYPLKISITELLGCEYELEFVRPSATNQEVVPSEETQEQNSSLNAALERAHLNAKYTFDTFVVGNNNKFAHAAALAVAESPGQIYNPLFIYGGPGLGKTHLMHSIAHFILSKDPETNVLYVTSETFTRELIDAIRNNNSSFINSFREKYRSVDVLLIDDIQFIIGKEATQEEFFHTFNDLRDQKKQIIISSDKPPKEFEVLDQRLRSRFEWGILADISLPDYETRVAILRKKEERDGYSIADNVIDYIASNIKSNVRELEGAFNKLIALSKLEKRTINLELAEESLKDIIAPEQDREVTPQLIIDTVAEHYHIQPDDILSSKRNSDIVFPRQVVMYLCRNMIDIPLKSIGSYVGRRDHTTVIHGINKVTEELSSSEKVRNDIDIIKKKINPS